MSLRSVMTRVGPLMAVLLIQSQRLCLMSTTVSHLQVYSHDASLIAA